MCWIIKHNLRIKIHMDMYTNIYVQMRWKHHH